MRGWLVAVAASWAVLLVILDAIIHIHHSASFHRNQTRRRIDYQTRLGIMSP